MSAINHKNGSKETVVIRRARGPPASSLYATHCRVRIRPALSKAENPRPLAQLFWLKKIRIWRKNRKSTRIPVHFAMIVGGKRKFSSFSPSFRLVQ